MFRRPLLALVLALSIVGLGAVPASAAPPSADDDLIATDMNTAVPVDLTGLAFDDDGDPLTFLIVSPPGNGALSDACTDGTCTYTPDTGFTGEDQLTFKANDGTQDSNVATLFVRVSPLAPIAFDESTNADTGVPTFINLPAQDAQDDPLTYTVVTQPSHGTLTEDCTDGECTYTSDAGFEGSDSFTWKASDGTHDSNVATMEVLVVQPPPPGVLGLGVSGQGPTSAVLTWENPEGVTGITVRYATGDQPPATPAEGTGVAVTGTPETVTVSGLTEGTQYAFSVFAVSSGGTSGPESVLFTPFSCPDLTPALDAGSLITGQSWVSCAGPGAHAGNLTHNTLLPRTGSTQAVMTSGTAAVAQPGLEGSGSGENLQSLFRGAHDASIYRIDVNVPPGATCLQFDYAFGSEEYPEYVGQSFNDGFLAQLDQYAWSVDSSSSITATDNFAKLADGSFISVNGPVFADPARVAGPDTNGTSYDGMSVPLVATTPITPGAHSIYLTIFDAGDGVLDSGALLDNLRTSSGTCTAGTNRPPTAVDDAATTTGAAVVVDVLANDTDADGHTLTVSGHSDPAHGSVTCSTTCTYTPDAGFTGTDTFTYTADDGHGGQDTALVSISVSASGPVAPVAGDDQATTPEDTSVQVDVRANDVDGNGDLITITTAAPAAAHGTVACSATSCTYTPAADYNGPDAFSYAISDGNGGTDTATVSITVTPVNDAPHAVDDATTTTSGVARTLNVAANDTDVDDTALTYGGATVTSGGGSVTCTAAGSCTYTPAAGFVGTATFTYTVSDGEAQDTGTVTVTVQPRPADLQVTHTAAPASAPVGQLVSRTAVVRNIGGQTSAATSLTVALPAGFKAKATPAGCSVTTTTLTCPVAALAVNATRTVTVQGAFVTVGSKTGTAQVTPPASDPAANNTATATSTATGKSCTRVGTFGADNLVGGAGVDVICGLEGNDVLDGSPGDDTLYGNEGNDTLDGDSGNDTMNGGSGTDTGRWSSLAAAVTVNLATNTATGHGSDTLASLENATGSNSGDTLTGTGGVNVLTGGNGNDTLVGAAGNDKLFGVAGNDTLDGGAGNDTLSGLDGNDTVRYSSLALGVSVDLGLNKATGGQGSDVLSAIENATGSSVADTLIGSAVANILNGLGGNDKISGLGGNDTINGGSGTDVCSQGAGTGSVTGCP